MKPPIPLEVLQAAQDAADRAAYDRAPNAAELRTYAMRLRGLDAMHNWAYGHLTATEADLNEMASRLSLGYGIKVEELREVAMRIYRDPDW
jgi:TorA maturation chaperone TorD